MERVLLKVGGLDGWMDGWQAGVKETLSANQPTNQPPRQAGRLTGLTGDLMLGLISLQVHSLVLKSMYAAGGRKALVNLVGGLGRFNVQRVES